MINKFMCFAVALYVCLTTSALGETDKQHQDSCSNEVANFNKISATVFVQTNKSSYSIFESITINAGILNAGADPIYVYGWISWGYGGGLVIHVRDASGNEIAPVVRDDTMLPPPGSDNELGLLVKLRDRGDFFGTQRTMRVRDLVASPGAYTLQVEYKSPLSCHFVGKRFKRLPVLWHEDASLFSAEVPFHISP